MSDIFCPLCNHEHDSGNYPDHVAEAKMNRFEFECAECGLSFEVEIEWDPVFYSSMDGAFLTCWIDPIC